MSSKYDRPATAGFHGATTAGDHGDATAGYGGNAAAGRYGTATAGYDGRVSAGERGVLRLAYFDEVEERCRWVIGYIGEAGLMPGVWYELDASHRIVPEGVRLDSHLDIPKARVTAREETAAPAVIELTRPEVEYVDISVTEYYDQSALLRNESPERQAAWARGQYRYLNVFVFARLTRGNTRVNSDGISVSFSPVQTPGDSGGDALTDICSRLLCEAGDHLVSMGVLWEEPDETRKEMLQSALASAVSQAAALSKEWGSGGDDEDDEDSDDSSTAGGDDNAPDSLETYQELD